MAFGEQVVVITGGGGGLGRLYALEFARRGAAVVVNARDPDLGASVAAEIENFEGRVAIAPSSVATVEGGKAIVDTALNTFGRLDVVINNAGTLTRVPFEQTRDATIGEILDVHVRGAFNVGRPAYEAMRARGYGRFVFTSSPAGVLGSAGLAAYAAAKWAVLGLSSITGLEGERHGILANSVLPIGQTSMSMSPTPERRAFVEATEPQLVTPMVVFLASAACRMNRRIFSAYAGKFAEAFVGLTQGWYAPSGDGRFPSAEDICEHLEEITARERYREPGTVSAEIAHLMGALTGRDDDKSRGQERAPGADHPTSSERTRGR